MSDFDTNDTIGFGGSHIQGSFNTPPRPDIKPKQNKKKRQRLRHEIDYLSRELQDLEREKQELLGFIGNVSKFDNTNIALKAMDSLIGDTGSNYRMLSKATLGKLKKWEKEREETEQKMSSTRNKIKEKQQQLNDL